MSAIALVLGLGLGGSARPAAAGARQDKAQLEAALGTWNVLRKNVRIHRLVNRSSPDGVRTLGGEMTVFGQRGGLVVSYFKAKKDEAGNKNGKSEIRRITIDFPAKAQLTTRHLKALLGTDASKIFPGRGGAKAGIKHFDLEILGGKVQSAKVVLTFGTWAPLGKGRKGKTVALSEIEGTFGIADIQTQPKLEAGLSTYLFLPDNLARTMGVGATSLKLVGLLRTKPLVIELGVDIASKEIPLVPNRSVVLKNARFKFVFEGGRPALAVAGKIELRPADQAPLALNGQVSIDAKGTVYAEGWMDQSDYWNNPFGLSQRLYIEKAGIGFGANFSTGVPTPIVAIEGGLSIRDRRAGPVRARGSVTLGIDSGNPTRNMIDAEIGNIRFADFLAAFHKETIPAGMRKTLSEMTLNNVRLSIVPPGPGVTLFGVSYEPGLKAEADLTYGSFTGKLYIDIGEQGVEAFGAMSPLRGRGFSFTGARPGTGPSLYLALKPQQRVLMLAANGQIEVLGAKAAADVYLSDAGFSATISSKILEGFSTRLDIAGTALSPNAAVYASFHLNDRHGLVQQLARKASEQIGRAARQSQQKYQAKKRALEGLRPQLNAKAAELARKQSAVRRDYQRLCGLLNQKRRQEAARRRKEAEIRALSAEIARDQRQLTAGLHRPAKNLRNIECPRGHGKYKDHCWSCPGGTKRDILQRWDSAKACFKKKNLLAKATPYRARKGAYVGCNRPLIKDIGRCWQCPAGYHRKVTIHRIDSAKGCGLQGSEGKTVALNAKRLKLTGMKTDLNVITKGIGKLAADLSGVGADICNQAKDTAAINSDPRVASTYAQWARLSLTVNQGQKALTAMQKLTAGSLGVAAWIARNGGRAASIVRIEEASFEGCLSALSGGHVAMKVRGKVADKPFAGTFNMNLRSPAQDIARLATLLTQGKPLRATASNGKCRRPSVPRPQTGGTRIGDQLAKLERGIKKRKPRPANRQVPKPAWAVERR